MIELHPPQMFKIEQNWGKIANYSPHAQRKSAPLQRWKCFYFRSATDTSWKERVLSLLQQKMLVKASKVTFASNEQGLWTPKDAVEVDWLYNFFWRNEVDNLNKISLEDANVTYFDNGYIDCSICQRRKCTGCKILLLADSKRQKQNKEYIPKDCMSLFDNTNRRLSATTELCYAVTILVSRIIILNAWDIIICCVLTCTWLFCLFCHLFNLEYSRWFLSSIFYRLLLVTGIISCLPFLNCFI